MLDSAEILLMRQLYVFHRDIILLVEPGAFLARNLPERGNAVGVILAVRQCRCRCPHADVVKLCDGLRFAVGQRAGGAEDAACGTGYSQARRDPLTRDESGDVILPDRPATMMAGQMHIRIPAAGHRQCAAVDMLVAAIGKAEADAAKAKPARRAGDNGAGECLGSLAARGFSTGIDDRRHIHPGGGQIGGGSVPVIIVGEDGDMVRRRGGKPVHIAAHRAGLHNPGAVIIGKADQPLGRAGTQQRASRIDPPQDLPRLAVTRCRQMIAGAFQNAVDAMVKDAENRASRHHPHIRHGGKLGSGGSGPVRAAVPADRYALLKKPAAGPEILIRQNHLGAGAPGGQRRHQPGRAGSDHQKVAMPESAVIEIGVILAGQRAKAGGAPDDRLVDPLPERSWPHEGLVVETGPQKIRKTVVHRHQVEAE